MRDAFFRAGVGAVVLDPVHRILVLKRKDASDNAWQMPQGGIGAREEPLDALYRELNEEVGLARTDLEVVKSYPGWLVYEVPVHYRNPKVGWGQAQRWILCRLLVSPTAVSADQIEVTEADWVSTDTLIARATSFRVPTYRRVIDEFGL